MFITTTSAIEAGNVFEPLRKEDSMFHSLTSRWLLIPVLLLGLVALASPAWAHGGFSGGHGYYGGRGGYYSGHGYYGGHSYYSPYYYGHSYSPSWYGYGSPYAYSYDYSAPAATYSYPATSPDYAWTPSGSGSGCR
jgi:hypothetical protein